MNFVATTYVFEFKLPGKSILRVELDSRNFPQSGTGYGFIPNGLSTALVEFNFSEVTSFRQIDPELV
jgi:hypothetical protein